MRRRWLPAECGCDLRLRVHLRLALRDMDCLLRCAMVDAVNGIPWALYRWTCALCWFACLVVFLRNGDWSYWLHAVAFLVLCKLLDGKSK